MTTGVQLRTELAAWKRLSRDPLLAGTIVIVLLSLFLFIVYPLIEILKESFIQNERMTLDVYKRIVGTAYIQRSLVNTLVVGALVAALGTFVGYVFAFTVAYVAVPFKKLFWSIAVLPIISPPFVIALSALMLFGRKGLITDKLLGWTGADIYGLYGVVLVETLAYFPIAFLMLIGMLSSIDPSMEEAAMNMGAGRLQVFRSITLPLTVPGIASAALLIFIQSLADFGNPMVIAGEFSMLPVMIYLQAIGGYDLAGGSVLAAELLSISIIVFLIQKYWVEKRSYVTVTGRPAKSRALYQDRAIVLPLFLFCMAVTLFTLTMYALVPIGAFVKLWGINYSFTLEHFEYVLTLGQKAIIDTTTLSLIATPITGILGMVIAFIVVRQKFLGRGTIEFTSMLSFAIPGTVIGIGYILAYNKPPLILTGSALILIIAFIFRNMPVGIRSGVSALQQIDPAIEEASTNLGASSFQTFTKVILPLISPAFFSGLVYGFVRCMTAISAVIFLVSARWNLMTVSILSQVDVGKLGAAAAYCTVLIVIVGVVIAGMRLVMKKMHITHYEF